MRRVTILLIDAGANAMMVVLALVVTLVLMALINYITSSSKRQQYLIVHVRCRCVPCTLSFSFFPFCIKYVFKLCLKSVSRLCVAYDD